MEASIWATAGWGSRLVPTSSEFEKGSKMPRSCSSSAYARNYVYEHDLLSLWCSVRSCRAYPYKHPNPFFSQLPFAPQSTHDYYPPKLTFHMGKNRAESFMISTILQIISSYFGGFSSVFVGKSCYAASSSIPAILLPLNAVLGFPIMASNDDTTR